MGAYDVSVVIPVYNGEKYIRQAVESVLVQDVSLDVFVIDDGSTDGTADVMSSFSDDERVHYLKNDRNLGVAQTRNRGVKLADAEYVAFLDADDWWEPGKLSAQLSLMREKSAVLCATARELINADGSTTGRVIGIPERIGYKDILKHNMIPCSAVLVKKEAMLKYPMEHDDSHEDYITWIKMIREYGFAVGIDKPFLKYRLSENSKSGSKFKSARMTYTAFRYAGLGVFSSMLHFVSYAFNGVKKYYG